MTTIDLDVIQVSGQVELLLLWLLPHCCPVCMGNQSIPLILHILILERRQEVERGDRRRGRREGTGGDRKERGNRRQGAHLDQRLQIFSMDPKLEHWNLVLRRPGASFYSGHFVKLAYNLLMHLSDDWPGNVSITPGNLSLIPVWKCDDCFRMEWPLLCCLSRCTFFCKCFIKN